MTDHLLVEGKSRLDSLHDERVQGPVQPGDGLCPVASMGDEFCDQGIVVGGNDAVRIGCGIDPDTRPSRSMVGVDSAW